MNDKLHTRKHIRLKEFDYSSPGSYFVTICTYDRECILSEVVGRGLAPAELRYTKIGEVAEKELLKLTERYNCLKIDNYVIMPNHIHVLFTLLEDAAGASPRPTIMYIISAYKSLAVRECKKICTIEKIFQTSFYDHVIRNEEDYREIYEYIQNNPEKWHEDKFYSE